ncbi:MAG: hypothetical protein ABI576_16920 [Flavobacterium sp.]
MILKPFSPKRWAYLFQCNNISVSVNSSVGKTEEGFTYDLLLASSSFFLRMLDKEKAETFGSLLTSGFGVTSSVFTTVSSDLAASIVGVYAFASLLSLTLLLIFSSVYTTSVFGIWEFVFEISAFGC